MNGTWHAERLLKALSSQYRITNLALDNVGCAGLKLTDGTHIQFECDSQKNILRTFIKIGKCDDFNIENALLFETLLTLNNTPSSSKLLLDEQKANIYLSQSEYIPDLSIEKLDALLDENLTTKNHIIEQLKRAERTNARTTPSQHLNLNYRNIKDRIHD
ncbi:hypothetical protein GV054_02355 [Marinomonas mediterranea]|uniref:type III secretion system chaperone n=1 Tax=Marinomonas mediterranea TaxID=119864 RepID=UPI002349DB9E|nr:type III secretion system chaperone [Marinomonas mediterranea]WCN11941.1 hypothetical protein GV054_02355 [Marinomonas mediterranea]